MRTHISESGVSLLKIVFLPAILSVSVGCTTALNPSPSEVIDKCNCPISWSAGVYRKVVTIEDGKEVCKCLKIVRGGGPSDAFELESQAGSEN